MRDVEFKVPVTKPDRFQLIGNTIAGTFRVDRVVAEGGFGVVYKAFHLHFRAPVALKCLKIPGNLSSEDRLAFLEQFRSEAEIQFQLSSQMPHIARPLHVEAIQTAEEELIPMMALEWLKGQTFEKLIEQRAFAGEPPMSLSEAMDLIGPVAESLHQAHHFDLDGEFISVIHRDVKPDNLFVTQVAGKPFVKLLDFGISKVRRAATHSAGRFSQTDGAAPFSPAYGAPEQWVPKRLGQTGPWTDVWGLALTLVEIIKGDIVVVGDHQAMMGTILDPRVRPSPRAEGVTVSDEVESVFLKALSVDPRYRYQSIESFWDALSEANYHSGDLTRQGERTQSGSRIALSPMSPPEPWRHPARPTLSASQEQHLPGMLAPVKLARTHVEDLPADSDASYPKDPQSDLMPVLAASTSWDYFDPEVPPSSSSSAPPLPRRKIEGDHLLEIAPEPETQREAPLSIELQAISSFPARRGREGSLCPEANDPEAKQKSAPPPFFIDEPESAVESAERRALSLIPTPGKRAEAK